MNRVADELKYPGLDALYVAIGEGHVSPQSIVARLSRTLSTEAEAEHDDVPLARPVKIKSESSQGVIVPGASDVWVRLAKCCMPVPGDEIMGFVSRGKGVSVHRSDCPNASGLAKEPERLLEVTWRPGKSTSFVVAVQVDALDRKRLLSDVATVLSDHHLNIVSASSSVGGDRITML